MDKGGLEGGKEDGVMGDETDNLAGIRSRVALKAWLRS